MPRDKAYLVIIQTGRQAAGFLDESYEEIKQLAESAGGVVTGVSQAKIPHPDPSRFVREGKLVEVRERAAQAGANVLIFNIDLSPAQARNIEAFCGVRPVDRTGLILDIFARRAESHEGRLQVELAQLQYLMPRLVGRGVIMSRLGGGIGTRGPGEQKLEVDRRKIRDRIQRVKGELEKLRTHRRLLRMRRKEKKLFQVSLVGYTNSGKSTLLNALTRAGTYTADKLFATLDPKTRIQSAGGGENVVFTDTVGFLRGLPHSLVEAFHATLEEVAEADLLLHVVDSANPQAMEQKRVVDSVLEEIGAAGKPILIVLNKADLLSSAAQAKVRELFPDGVLISAKLGLGLQSLLAKLSAFRLVF